MTPEAAKARSTPGRSAAPAATAGHRTRSLRAGTALVGVGYGRETLGLDVAAAGRAGRVASLREAPQRRLDLLQLGARGVRDCAEHVVVLALGHLLGKVGRERIRLVPQIGARVARPLAQLLPAFEQPLAYPVAFPL